MPTPWFDYKISNEQQVDTKAMKGYELKLGCDDIMEIHEAIVDFSNGIPGLKNEELFDAIVSAPYTAECFSKEDPDIFDRAGRLLFDFINCQVFNDCNLASAFAVPSCLLNINGFEFDRSFGKETMIMIALDISKGNILDPETVGLILRSNSHIISLEDFDLLSSSEKEDIRRWYIDDFTGRFDTL